MTAVRRIWSIALAATTALAAGCSAGTTPTDGPFPPRPVTIDSSRVPPCDLLSDPQQAELGLRTGRPGNANVNGRPSSTCTWLGSGAVDYNVQFIPVDAAIAVTEPGARITVINGFGAVQSVPGETFGGTPFCQVAVDAAAGQTIRVQASTRPGEPPIGIDEQCRRAVNAASMVMTTVAATASR